MKLSLNIKPKVRGSISLGPKPGTPEFEEEQRRKREAAKERDDGEPEHGGGERSA